LLSPSFNSDYDRTEAAARIAELDKNRSSAHENAIRAVAKLNRLCDASDLPLFYPGDVDNRYQIADFAMNFVVEVSASPGIPIRLGEPEFRADRHDRYGYSDGPLIQ